MTDAKHGDFIWYDFLTTDPKGAVAFYSEVIGWKAQPFENAPYTMFLGSQGPLGGVGQMPDAAVKMGAPPHWTTNVCCDDVDATAKKAKELGGKILVEPGEFPSVGRLGVIADPQGTTINIFK